MHTVFVVVSSRGFIAGVSATRAGADKICAKFNESHSATEGRFRVTEEPVMA